MIYRDITRVVILREAVDSVTEHGAGDARVVVDCSRSAVTVKARMGFACLCNQRRVILLLRTGCFSGY